MYDRVWYGMVGHDRVLYGVIGYDRGMYYRGMIGYVY